MSQVAEQIAAVREHRDVVAPGALVRTLRCWPGGVHRAAVSRVFERNGAAWANVAGQDYACAELLVIRPPISP